MAGNGDLEWFHASFNQITELHPDFFQNCPKLKRIVLIGNQLSTIHSRLFKNMTSLVELQLSNNLIETIYRRRCVLRPEISGANAFVEQQIESVGRKLVPKSRKSKTLGHDMSLNQVELLPSKFFSKNHALFSINFTFNNLKKIDIEFNPNRNYEHLLFFGNKCVNVGILDEKGNAELIEEIARKCLSLK